MRLTRVVSSSGGGTLSSASLQFRCFDTQRALYHEYRYTLLAAVVHAKETNHVEPYSWSSCYH